METQPTPNSAETFSKEVIFSVIKEKRQTKENELLNLDKGEVGHAEYLQIKESAKIVEFLSLAEKMAELYAEAKEIGYSELEKEITETLSLFSAAEK